ncbi:hypothetical protein HF078_20485 [Bacillus sp. RO2]|uniref:hypothetical protein n=1 Tax=Bacillus sp. RO2 TaxID=2723913 RepID=UPI00145E3FD0|nr:hypothetical protein [Bacillus sp. RO2]NMH75460.1 hypothetical protein [Bacillus sp. RO2]
MGIVYVECCDRKRCCCCCDDDWDRCPNPVRWNEGAECEGLRQDLADRGVVTVSGLQFRFYNQTMKYSATFCTLGFRTPTVTELQVIATSLTSAEVGGTPLCPMLVWATNMGNPVLVEVFPSTGIVQEVRTPSRYCRAYRICIAI